MGGNCQPVVPQHHICNIFAEGSCSPHHRGAPRPPRWDATASLTANRSLRNQKYWRHRRRPLRILQAPLSSRRIDEGLKLRSCPPQTGQMPDRGLPSRPVTASSPPVRPARLVSYYIREVLATEHRVNTADVWTPEGLLNCFKTLCYIMQHSVFSVCPQQCFKQNQNDS